MWYRTIFFSLWSMVLCYQVNRFSPSDPGVFGPRLSTQDSLSVFPGVFVHGLPTVCPPEASRSLNWKNRRRFANAWGAQMRQVFFEMPAGHLTVR